jgi:hypothetical protein
MAAMRHGKFREAWETSDRILRERIELRQQCWNWPRHLQFVWNGSEFTGRRVLIHCYHGLGDTIQFIRFAQPLRHLASEVAIWVQPELLGLAGTAPGIDKAIPLHDGGPAINRDVDIEVMELAHALRADWSSLPGTVPYLFPPRLPTQNMQSDCSIRIGIAWESGDWNRQRSIPASLLSSLNSIGRIQWFSLKPIGICNAPNLFGLKDLSTSNILELAARIKGLDLVISVDTMVAHLAGALGIPVWTLLCKECDWRWMENSSRTPWYPAMRLFRQQRSTDWSNVIDELCDALSQFVSVHSSGRSEASPQQQ